MEPTELSERFLPVARIRRDDEIGPKRDDRLEAGRDHPAHAWLLLGRGRPVAEVGDADESILAAEGEDQLGRAGDERDDPSRSLMQRQRSPAHVGDGERRRGQRSGGEERQGQHQRAG